MNDGSRRGVVTEEGMRRRREGKGGGGEWRFGGLNNSDKETFPVKGNKTRRSWFIELAVETLISVICEWGRGTWLLSNRIKGRLLHRSTGKNISRLMYEVLEELQQTLKQDHMMQDS
ncbi:hypothetical protein HA466_0233390 [Hirschfeldia incana]|nr:hypothetical protein HA466_0233390 [Hirschfeldia incana]